MSHRYTTALVFCAITCTGGCGTLSNWCDHDPNKRLAPYGGVTTETALLKASADRLAESKPFVFDRIQVIRSACDIPLCAVADTVALPVTIPYSIGRAVIIADQALAVAAPTNRPDQQ
jgi:hypothetical protein